MFVRGDLSFQLDSSTFQFENQKISSSGVYGLSWKELDPIRHYGRSIFVNVTINQPVPLNFIVPAQIIREFTRAASTLGLLFHFEEQPLKEFTEFAKQHGEPPIAYTRKFPRIPAIHLIQTYPLKVHVPIQDESVTFEVENISPEGIMIFTENPLAFKMVIEEGQPFMIDPGSYFPTKISIKGSIRRILDDFNLGTGAPVRHLGIQLIDLAEADRKNLMALLKDILLQIKDKLKDDED
jgi:hypothetical protein